MKKNLKKLFALMLVLALVLVLGMSSAMAESKPIVLRVNMSEGAASNKSLAIEEVKKEIEEKTEGCVVVEIHNNGELGTFQDDVEAIVSGANIVSGTSPSAYCDYGSPDLMGLDLMLCMRSYEDCDTLNQSELFAELSKQLEESSGIKALAVNWGNMPRCVLANKPINTVEDLKGMIVRLPLAAYIAFFNRLGCTTQSMTLSDTYTALSQGTIDACEFGYDILYNNSMYEVAKYCYVTQHTYAPSLWSMNADLFYSMTEADQQVVMDAFHHSGQIFEKMNDDNMAEYRAKMEEQGVTFVEPSEADKAILAAAAEDSAKDFTLSDGLMERIATTLGR